MQAEDRCLKLTLDVTNFTERRLGLGRALLEDDLELISKLALRASEAVCKQHADGLLPYLNVHEQDISPILSLADCSKGKYDNVIVLGIGGSALGLTALQTALRHPYHNTLSNNQRGGIPRLFVLDNIDPYCIDALFKAIDPARSVFFVISKSGTTAETMSQYLIVRRMIENAKLDQREHIIPITDPSSGVLRDIVKRDGLKSFEIHPKIGGRFSVLTPVGLAPAAMMGMDIRALLEGARCYSRYALHNRTIDNPSLLLACCLYLLFLKGYTNHVMMPYSSQLRDVADWYRQLWAESLGKKLDRTGKVVETGPTPIKALGVTDQHSQVQLYAEGPRDKAFIFVGVKDFNAKVEIPTTDISALSYLGGRTMNELIEAEMIGTMVALTDGGRPNCVIEMNDVSENSVSQLMMFWQMAVSYIGELLNIDAYDQPGVEAGKIAAYALMGRPGFEKEAERIRGSLNNFDNIRAPKVCSFDNSAV